MKNKENRIEKLEKAIIPEELHGVFHSYEYENRLKWDKAIEDYKISNPKGKLTIIEHIGSYEDDLTGEITKRTMFKGEVKDD